MLRLLDPGFGCSALFEGTRLISALRDIVGSPKIEDLPIDFTAVAVDVLRQREVWLRDGDMWDAIRASFAIPGLFTPHMIHGRPLVDGGLLAPLPIAATRLSDAHRLIAVDMHGWPSVRRTGAGERTVRQRAELALVADRVAAQPRRHRQPRCRAHAAGLHRPDGAPARHHAGADRARAAGAGSAGTRHPHPARCLPVLRVLARRRAHRHRPRRSRRASTPRATRRRSP